jgi:hypothetical protein
VNIMAEYAPSFFSVAFLEAVGGEGTYTIRDVVKEDVTSPSTGAVDNLPCIRFVETKSKLVLKKTNAQTMAEAWGPDTINWAGATVVLRVETMKVGGKSIRWIAAHPANGADGGDPPF